MEIFDDDIDEGITWADPAIRTEYEAALGRFILAFNEADYRLSQVIAAELAKRGHPELAETATKGTFAQRLEKLDLLVSSTKDQQLSALPVAKLRLLNTDRNNLAHGHFDQDPYDGSYRLILAAKTRDYPISRIVALGDELAQIVEFLRTTEILYDFEDLSKQSTDG
jgi:plasmid maintenance system killer protein